MNFRLRFFKTLPQIQHQITYFLFISSFILQFIGFCPAPKSYIGDDFFHQKLIKVSNSFGKDYYVGFWRYCVVEHYQDIDNEIYDPAGLELALFKRKVFETNENFIFEVILKKIRAEEKCFRNPIVQ